MNSKKALKKLMNDFGFGAIGRSLCEIIKQDLDRLEELEIANKNNENLVKENIRLVNENLLLKDELNNLKTKEKKYE